MTKLDKQINMIDKLLKEKESLMKEAKTQEEKDLFLLDCEGIYEIKKTLVELDGNVEFM